MHRRDFLKFSTCALGLLTPGGALAIAVENGILCESILRLEGSKPLRRSARLLLPRHRDPKVPLPLLVLLHGLGETSSESAGLLAWSERYGLVRAYERLAHPPVTRTLPKATYLTDTYLQSLNRSLEQRPFAGMAILCPITPNVYRQPPTSVALDRYADWIASVLLPAAAESLPKRVTRITTALDGCSLGGYVALEVFLRKPELFGSVGMVQGAIGVGQVEQYGSLLRNILHQHGDTAIRLGTSTLDPYRKANDALARALRARDVACTLEVPPGPHDQPFLREVGTLSMLDWHDRMFVGRTIIPPSTTARDISALRRSRGVAPCLAV